jgi:hypothetical protein
MVYAEGTPSGSSVVPLSALYGTTYVGGTGACTIENEIVGCGTASSTLLRDGAGNFYGLARWPWQLQSAGI